LPSEWCFRFLPGIPPKKLQGLGIPHFGCETTPDSRHPKAPATSPNHQPVKYEDSYLPNHYSENMLGFKKIMAWLYRSNSMVFLHETPTPWFHNSDALFHGGSEFRLSNHVMLLVLLLTVVHWLGVSGWNAVKNPESLNPWTFTSWEYPLKSGEPPWDCHKNSS